MEKKTDIHSFSTKTVFVLSFILIGAPLWWKTTEVYRYPVPHDDCQNLLSEPIKHMIPVKLVIDDQDIQQGFFWEELLKLSNYNDLDFAQPSVSFEWSMSAVSSEETNVIEQFHNITALDAAMLKTNDGAYNVYGEIVIFVLNKNYAKEPKFTLGCGRLGYILNDADNKNLAIDVLLLAKKMAQVDRLRKLYTPASSYSGDKIPDKDRMRHLRSSKNFDITFSLIVPEPQILEVHWDIQNAIDVYLNDVLENLSLVSNIKVKSQVLYMTSLPIPIRSSSSTERKEFIVYSEDLPPLINPIEAKLGSDTSINPNLNFVLYIPTQQQTSLRIYASKSEPLHSNAFLLPQWGGFMIYNCPLPENSSLPHSVHLSVHSFMGVFLSQFRLLLGLPERHDLSNEKFQILPGPVVNKWELDFLIRKNAQEQLSASMSSLSSLSQLLKTIGNIVIKDEIGEKIHFALSSTIESLKLLSEGSLEEGFFKSQSAFASSDEAFFDPSLLALLYFPEDQKYAIYIPLFLPISIPVIASLRHLWLYWRQKEQKLKTE